MSGARSTAEQLVERILQERGDAEAAASELDRVLESARGSELEAEIRGRLPALKEALLLRLERAPDDVEALMAWLTLVAMGPDPEDIHGVTTAACARYHPHDLRQHACAVLAAVFGPKAAATLMELAGSRGPTAVRVAAVEALADTGAPQARQFLKTLLETDLPRDLWYAASGALERLS